jgi:hypothetical protein
MYCCSVSFVCADTSNIDDPTVYETIYHKFAENSIWYETYLAKEDLLVFYSIKDSIDTVSRQKEEDAKVQFIARKAARIQDIHQKAFQKFQTAVEESRRTLAAFEPYKDYTGLQSLSALQKQLELLETASAEGHFPQAIEDITCITGIRRLFVVVDRGESQAAQAARKSAERAKIAAEGALRAEQAACSIPSQKGEFILVKPKENWEPNKYTVPQIDNPDFILPGMELIIPPIP